jgi:hypothetical protein
MPSVVDLGILTKCVDRVSPENSIDPFSRIDTIGPYGSAGKIRITGRSHNLGELFKDEVGQNYSAFHPGTP